MDLKIQIQTLKSQIDNMKLQLDNIETQYNNMLNFPRIIANQISEQILNLSVQMINSGIQTFNYTKNLVMNNNKFNSHLKNISELLNSLINGNNTMPRIQSNREYKINAIFNDDIGGPRINISIDNNETVGALLNKFIEKKTQYWKFISNSEELSRNDNRRCDVVFTNSNNPNIFYSCI